MNKRLVLGVASLLVIAISSPSVSAVDGEGIVMSPAAKSLELDAGSKITGEFYVINNGQTEYDFKVYATPYSVDDRYRSNFDSQTKNADVYRWVSFPTQKFHLKPSEKAVVPYAINVPTDALPGGHYGVLFAETMSKDESSITRNKRVGSIMYATVKGDYITDGRLVKVVIPWLQVGGEPSATVTLENTGNTHYASNERLSVKNILGQTVYDYSTEYMVLPHTTRDINLTWQDGATLGVFTVETTSEVVGKINRHSSMVLIAPGWFLLLIGLTLLGLVVLLWRRIQR